MDEPAHEFTEGPVSDGVNDRVERHAEDQEQEVRDRQVQDEKVRRVAELVVVPDDDHDYQGIAQAA